MNHLIHETSPYLRQHAHNPVEWYAWKPEAFARAKAENKPILVSIGYSTCHWCHVMERESFEDIETARFMNEYFINIKVDREERPDVDQIYMEACQIISGSGGWPLNAFLTPEGRPFFAGTYYPPSPGYQRPSWRQVLTNLATAFKTNRAMVEEQAAKMTEIIQGSDANMVRKVEMNWGKDAIDLIENQWFKKDLSQKIYKNLYNRFDREEGGFGGAPKFPSTMSLQYLAAYYFYEKTPAALKHLNLSLEKMIQGGIYDQIGGGFARYATDAAWLIPHFEKMLYDNALIISVLSDAYRLTKKNIYKETIEETLEFVQREMTARNGGFYAAYDADSEGEEGKFYVWDMAEIKTILGEDADLFCKFYGCVEGGNFEGQNILWRPYDETEQEELFEGLDADKAHKILERSRKKLLKVRAKRVPPSLDNKIILSWNALMISGYCKAFSALGNDAYRAEAIGQTEFILNNFVQDEPDSLWHTMQYDTAQKHLMPQYDAFLDDYAFFIEALLDVYEISFDKKYLFQARQFADKVIQYFWDENQHLFYFTSAQQKDILLRKKDLYDSATPSSNSTMAKNLWRLGHFFERADYKQLVIKMLSSVQASVEKYPSSFSKWASVFLNVIHPTSEIAILGEKAFEQAKKLQKYFLPNIVLIVSEVADDSLPLLKDRFMEGKTLFYLCQNASCQMPVTAIADLLKMLNVK
ncbi:MAG: hypothetical protein RLZZ628_233 [Bacteroidota bacterium]|jgi:uncharacterized protein YyaL (SSP411 family)